MKEIVVERFGGPEVLSLRAVPTPEPGSGQVRVRLTSIGMNYADLMARRGQYKMMSGDPPFVPGIEAGGVIDALGGGVTTRRVGQRVILGVDVPRVNLGGSGGTYRSHYVCPADATVIAPDVMPDEQLGAVWLTYLTAWGCLIWKQRLFAGQIVGIPAASSGVGMAAAQVVRRAGGIPIGLTTSPGKIDTLQQLPESTFEHIVVTDTSDWPERLRQIVGKRGVDVFFDPVAAGDFLAGEIRCLAQGGTIWLYGLLGTPGVIDLHPLIRKQASLRGWLLYELASQPPAVLEEAYRAVLSGFEDGSYRQHVAQTFPLDEARRAHETMEQGGHIGKLILVP